MIVANEELIRGNTVLAPKQAPNRYREIEKQQINTKKKNRKIKNRLIIMRNIVSVFIIGLTIVGRYNSIYKMQKQLNTTKSSITELSRANDNLKVELVKYNNLHYIEEIATTKLKMITPNRNDAIYCNISKEIITSTSKKSDSNTNIISKIVKDIF